MLTHHLHTTNTQQAHIHCGMRGMVLTNNKPCQQQIISLNHKQKLPTNTSDTNNTKVNIKQLIGHSRQYCQQYLQQQQLNSTDFAHWLAITELAVLLVFEHHICVAVEYIC